MKIICQAFETPIQLEYGKPLDKVKIPVYGVYRDSTMSNDVSLSIYPDKWSYSKFDPTRSGNQILTIEYKQDGVKYTTDVLVNVSSQPIMQPTIIQTTKNPIILDSRKSGKIMAKTGYKTAIQVFPGNTGFYAVPNKDTFVVGEQLNKSDFTVIAIINGSMINVPEDQFTVTRFQEVVSQPGYRQGQLFVRYGGHERDISVFLNVVKAGASSNGLVATTQKTQYYIGDTIDKGSVTIKYNGNTVPSSEWDFIGMDSSKVGDKTIIVIYDMTPGEAGGTVTTTFKVNIGTRVNALAATTTKGEYRYGESFDYSSLKVTYFDHNGVPSNIPATSVKVMGFDSTGASTIDPYVVYNGLKAPINVVEGY
jgi:hypothetical protein